MLANHGLEDEIPLGFESEGIEGDSIVLLRGPRTGMKPKPHLLKLLCPLPLCFSALKEDALWLGRVRHANHCPFALTGACVPPEDDDGESSEI